MKNKSIRDNTDIADDRKLIVSTNFKSNFLGEEVNKLKYPLLLLLLKANKFLWSKIQHNIDDILSCGPVFQCNAAFY